MGEKKKMDMYLVLTHSIQLPTNMKAKKSDLMLWEQKKEDELEEIRRKLIGSVHACIFTVVALYSREYIGGGTSSGRYSCARTSHDDQQV